MFEINPYATLAVADETVTITAPKAGAGLTTIHVTTASDPALFLVLSELGEANFRYLDLQDDLSHDQHALLADAGFLVVQGSQPEIPLFCCDLTDFDQTILNDAEDLIVNPTFEFEPFDLSRFRQLSQQHLSPRSAAAKLRVPLCDIQLRISIPLSIVDKISRLEPGAKPPSDFDPEVAAKLAGAGIFTTTKRLENEAADAAMRIEQARSDFQKGRYAVLRDLLPTAYVRAMQRFYRAYVDGGFMPFSDPQVPLRYRQHNEPFASMLHRELATTMSLVVGEDVQPSYCYAASYKPNAELKPHVDREQCEYSISLQVDYLPEPADGVSPWPIFVEPATPELPQIANDSTERWHAFYEENRTGKTSVRLANGDGLFYKGRELVHYRFPLPDGNRSTSIFLHYVGKDFTGSLN